MDICVFAATSDLLAPEFYEAAEALGKLIGRNACRLVYGGGMSGLMGACARGVIAADGKLLGVSPNYFNEPGVLYTESGDFVFTDTMRERKQYMDDHSEAVILLPGGIGSMDEFFEILTLKHLGRSRKPIAILNTLHYYDPLLLFLNQAAKMKFMGEDVLEEFRVCDTPEAAIEHVLNSPHSAAE